MQKIALRGHVSPETAYMVNDYPYGNKRCRIRFWLEDGGKKGKRFVSQTENPKTLVWNAPKKSTYGDIIGLILDEKGHVQQYGFGLMRDFSRFEECARLFPEEIPGLRVYAKCAISYRERALAGEVYFTVNGERREYTAGERERDEAKLQEAKDALAMLDALEPAA